MGNLRPTISIFTCREKEKELKNCNECPEAFVANVRAWRRGDIPCYVSPDMLLIKDMKMKIYSKAGLYSSVGYVAE